MQLTSESPVASLQLTQPKLHLDIWLLNDTPPALCLTNSCMISRNNQRGLQHHECVLGCGHGIRHSVRVGCGSGGAVHH